MRDARHARDIQREYRVLRCDAWLSRYFGGEGYLLTLGVLALVGHIFALEIITMPLMLLSASVGIGMSGSFRPFSAVLVTFIFQCSVENAPSMPSFSSYYYTNWRGVLLFSLLVLVATVSVVYLIRNKRISIARIRALPYKGVSVLLSISLILSGAASGEWLGASLLWGALEAVCLVLLPYFLMLALSDSDADGALDYLISLAEILALVLIVETAHLYLTGDVIADGVAQKGQVLYGWGIWTTAGMDMAVLIPLLALGAIRERRPLFRFLLMHVLYISCVLTLSRNALLFGGLALLLSAVAVLKKAPLRRIFSRIYFALGIIAILVLPVFVPHALRLLNDFLERGFSDNGRIELWRYGIECFLESPIFGKGFFALSTDTFRAEDIFPPMLHNTFIQLAAAAGAFGLLSYIAWESARLWRLILPCNTERFLLFLSLMTLLLMSLFDNFIFHLQPTFIFALLLATAEKEKSLREA